MKKPLIIMLAALTAVFGGIFGYKGFVDWQKSQFMANFSPPPVTVSSAIVKHEQWQNKVASVGGLDAIQGVEVSSEVPGKVISIEFESGHRVEAGALLVQLDATAETARLRALRAEFRSAELDYDRAKGLARTSAVSQAQLDRSKAKMDSLQAQVEEQRALINKKAIRAPFSGELGIRQVNIGQFISPGTEIVSLQNLNPIYVNFTLPERQLGALSVGQKIEVDVAAFPNKQFIGDINALSPKVERTTRNVRVQATLANPDFTLRPGMFARINVLIGGASDVLTLPRMAIVYRPYGNSVFMIKRKDQDLIATTRQIDTGRIRGGYVEVLSGLKEGDLVVRTGHIKLRNGQKVQIDNSVVLPGDIVEP